MPSAHLAPTEFESMPTASIVNFWANPCTFNASMLFRYSVLQMGMMELWHPGKTKCRPQDSAGMPTASKVKFWAKPCSLHTVVVHMGIFLPCAIAMIMMFEDLVMSAVLPEPCQAQMLVQETSMSCRASPWHMPAPFLLQSFYCWQLLCAVIT